MKAGKALNIIKQKVSQVIWRKWQTKEPKPDGVNSRDDSGVSKTGDDNPQKWK